MLTILVPGDEFWDDINQQFLYGESTKIKLEHSLVSVQKWEASHEKHYLGNETITPEEKLDYIKCMTITQNVSDDVYMRLTKDNIQEINAYINKPMTAATFKQDPNTFGKKVGHDEYISAETIYYWMIQLQIPMECEKWHLNRLLALIQYCNNKQTPPKKMTKKDTAARYRAINARNRAKYHSKG